MAVFTNKINILHLIEGAKQALPDEEIIISAVLFKLSKALPISVEVTVVTVISLSLQFFSFFLCRHSHQINGINEKMIRFTIAVTIFEIISSISFLLPITLKYLFCCTLQPL